MKVIIPQEDIDELEEARKGLFALFPDATFSGKALCDLHDLHKISEPMWKITHKKYPEYKTLNEKIKEWWRIEK